MSLRSLLAALALCGLGSWASAQDQPAAEAPTLKDLVAQRDAALDKLGELRKKFQEAAPADRPAIEEEFKKTVTDVRERIFPELEKQLPAALAATPGDEVVQDAASSVLQLAYGQNRFAKVHEVAELLLKHDPTSQMAANFDGVARFAEHDFAGSVATLEAAEKAGTLMPELGGRYLEDAKQYVDFWKAESAIREQTDAVAEAEKQLPQVKFVTTRGDIGIELFEDEAPNTVANFVSLVESKFYDGLRFHRVIAGFMAQGGCPNTRDEAVGQPGTGGPGYNIKCECDAAKARKHFAGSLSMAHAGKDTGGSQFFLTHLPTSHLNGVHTVFGRVVEGLDVVRALQMGDQITAATVVRKRNHEYKPETLPE